MQCQTDTIIFPNMEETTKLTPYEEALKQALEHRGYSINVYEEEVSRYNDTYRRYAECEKYTHNGVDQILILEPFTIEAFEGYCNEYDVDEDIDLHREGKSFRSAFSIRQALEEFEGWQETIEADLNFILNSREEIEKYSNE